MKILDTSILIAFFASAASCALLMIETAKVIAFVQLPPNCAPTWVAEAGVSCTGGASVASGQVGYKGFDHRLDLRHRCR